MTIETTLRIPIAAINWRPIGDETGTDEPQNHLLAVIAIGSARMYVNAIEVHTNVNGMQDVVDKACVGLLDIINQVNGDCDVCDSVMINGREYVLIATPFVKA